MKVGGMNQLVSVVLADDHGIFVEGISVLLDAERDLRVVALARDAQEALQALRTHRPDIVVVDTHLPRGEVEEILRSAAGGATRALLLDQDSAPDVSAWLRRGADAVMTKHVSARELAHTIRTLARGDVPPPPALVAAAPPRRQASHRDGHIDMLLRSLSQRERQILSLLVSGYSNRRIAEECYLSLNTVRAHVQNVLVKLGVHSKLEAATVAMRQGGVPAQGAALAGHRSLPRL
jgi:two-component system, NarL family, nitrate/nitrite response regulator NarL